MTLSQKSLLVVLVLVRVRAFARLLESEDFPAFGAPTKTTTDSCSIWNKSDLQGALRRCPDSSVIVICSRDHSRNDSRIGSAFVLRGCFGTVLGRVDKGGGLPQELAACPSVAALCADSSRTAIGDGLPRELEGRRLSSSQEAPMLNNLLALNNQKSKPQNLLLRWKVCKKNVACTSKDLAVCQLSARGPKHTIDVIVGSNSRVSKMIEQLGPLCNLVAAGLEFHIGRHLQKASAKANKSGVM